MGSSKLYVALAVTATFSSGGPAVELAWSPNTETNLTGYRLYWGTNSGRYTTNRPLPLLPTSVTASNPLPGQTFYFALTALNNLGQESDFSSEASYSIPLPPITNAPPLTLTWKTGSSPVISWAYDPLRYPCDQLFWTSNLVNWILIPNSFYTIHSNRVEVPFNSSRPVRIFRLTRPIVCP